MFQIFSVQPHRHDDVEERPVDFHHAGAEFVNQLDQARTLLVKELSVARATEEEKVQQIARLRAFQELHKNEASAALARLKETALKGENVFAELMETVRHCSLGQITQALFEVGGQYRRNM